MKAKAISVSNQGKRDYNEDSYLSIADQNLYVVCDGVGGRSKGEIASQLACRCFTQQLAVQEDFGNNIFEKVLRQTEQAFDDYIRSNHDSDGMASTLTLLKLKENKAYVAHVGDSRVYQVRNGEILFQTKDHSYVNEQIDNGSLSEEEAKNHPKKNQITRAIQGTKKYTSIDTKILTDVQVNDYFLLCTDGVLEAINNDFISANFINENALEEIKGKVEEKCLADSMDNFTATLVHVTEVFATAESINSESPKKKHRMDKRVLWIPLVVIFSLIAYYFIENSKQPTKNEKEEKSDVEVPVLMPKEENNQLISPEKSKATTSDELIPKRENWREEFLKEYWNLEDAEQKLSTEAIIVKYRDLLKSLPQEATEERNRLQKKINEFQNKLNKKDSIRESDLIKPITLPHNDSINEPVKDTLKKFKIKEIQLKDTLHLKSKNEKSKT